MGQGRSLSLLALQDEWRTSFYPIDHPVKRIPGETRQVYVCSEIDQLTIRSPVDARGRTLGTHDEALEDLSDAPVLEMDDLAGADAGGRVLGLDYEGPQVKAEPGGSDV